MTEANRSAAARVSGVERDVEEIKRVHTQWWAANHGIDIDKMKECFVDEYVMFNLNGHPYYGLAEKVKLWEYLRTFMEVPEPVRVWDRRVTVDGNMAYLTGEGELPVRVASSPGMDSSLLENARGGDVVRYRFRETTVFRRESGAGGKKWKICHFHCSPLPPEDEPRLGLGDSARERGKLGPVEIMT